MWLEAMRRDREDGFLAGDGWRLPVRMEPFLEYLEVTVTVTGSTDEEAVAAFMLLPEAENMPTTLKDELRRAGLL